jgi:hypothetical protein
MHESLSSEKLGAVCLDSFIFSFETAALTPHPNLRSGHAIVFQIQGSRRGSWGKSENVERTLRMSALFNDCSGGGEGMCIRLFVSSKRTDCLERRTCNVLHARIFVLSKTALRKERGHCACTCPYAPTNVQS